MRGAIMLGAVALAAALAGCGPRRGTELNNQWFVGDWSPSRLCRQSDFTSFKADGSYTAPMNATRRALGIWSFENGVLTIGTVFRQEQFRITRVADDEIRSAPVDGQGTGATLYRCSR
jgi:hypothetical protein